METKVKDYINNVEQLKSNFKWKLNLNMMTLISAIYVMNDKILSVEELKKFTKGIHKKVSLFSPFRSYQKYNVSAYLVAKYKNPKEKLQQLFDIFHQLRVKKLPNNAYTIISALSLLNDYDPECDLEPRIDKIKDIYKKMKQNHFFLTSYSDYPLATLLSIEEKEPDQIIEEIEFYYHNLSFQGFKKGNNLQFLSHILMVLSHDNKDELVNKVISIKKELIKYKLKIKPNHYAITGILTSIHLAEEDFNRLTYFLEQLNKSKYLKRMKSLNIIVATMLLVSDKIKDDKNLLETNLSTTIESIIQAQNAALIASIAATSAASAAAASS